MAIVIQILKTLKIQFSEPFQNMKIISTIAVSSFPNSLKLANIKRLHKKAGKTTKKTIDQSVLYRQHRNI